MSLSNFLSYLQQILTMIDPRSAQSVSLGKGALSTTIALALSSGKVDEETIIIMRRTEMLFDKLVENASDFAGKPGEFSQNKVKRNRLRMTIRPGC